MENDKKKRLADALKVVHKSDEELHEMADKYSKEVGFAGGTIAKVGGPAVSEFGSIARRLEGEGVNRSKEALIKSAKAKISQAQKEGGKALERIMEQLRTGKGR